MGGLAILRIDNKTSASLQIQDIEIEGVPIQTLLQEAQVFWWRQRPAILEPGQTGAVEIAAQARVFPLSRKPLRIRLVDTQGLDRTTSLVTYEDRLCPSFLFQENDLLCLYVRNDEPWMRYTLTGLWVNGESLEIEACPEVLYPGDLSLITVRGFDRVRPRDLAVIEVTAQDVSGRAVRVLRACTLLQPRFPIGVWQNSTAFRTHEYREELRELRIDCPFIGLDLLPKSEDLDFASFTEKYGFRPMWNPRPFQVDEESLMVTFTEENLDFMKRFGSHERIIAFNSAEEPDHSKNLAQGYSNSLKVMLITEALRQVAPAHPITGTLCVNRKYHEYTPLFDIAIMDAYRVGAPSTDSWPFLWGNYIETVHPYTWDLKANAEPSPVWVWAQGIHCWGERLIANKDFGRPIPSAHEARSQLYLQLGAGAKGVLWFQHIPLDSFLNNYRNKLTQGDGAILARASQLQDKIEEGLAFYERAWHELRETMRSCNLEMCLLRPLLSRGDPYPHIWVSTSSQPKRLFVSAIASLDGMVLYAVNLDYDFDPKGYRFHEQRDVTLSFKIPGWIRDIEKAWLVAGEEFTGMPFSRRGDIATVTLSQITDGACILVGSADLISTLTPNTESLLP